MAWKGSVQARLIGRRAAVLRNGVQIDRAPVLARIPDNSIAGISASAGVPAPGPAAAERRRRLLLPVHTTATLLPGCTVRARYTTQIIQIILSDMYWTWLEVCNEFEFI